MRKGKEMNQKEWKLAVEIFEWASEALHSQGSDAMKFPDEWTQEERHLALFEYHKWNGNPEVYEESYGDGNDIYWVSAGTMAWYLAQKIKKEFL